MKYTIKITQVEFLHIFIRLLKNMSLLFTAALFFSSCHIRNSSSDFLEDNEVANIDEVHCISPSEGEDLNWLIFTVTKYKDASQYHIQIAEKKDDLIQNSNLIINEDSFSTNTIILDENSGLLVDRTYFWRVRAFDRKSMAWGDWSFPVKFSIFFDMENILNDSSYQTIIHKPITSLQFKPDYDNRIEVEVKKNSKDLSDAIKIAANSNSIDLPFIIDNGDYISWRIRVKNNEGAYSAYSNVYSFDADFWYLFDWRFELINIIEHNSTIQFKMGSSKLIEQDELPHDIQLDISFSSTKYEITNEQYIIVLNWALDKGYVFIDGTTLKSTDGSYPLLKTESMDFGSQWGISISDNHLAVNMGYGEHPVIGVTWYGAISFCNFLSEIEGKEEVYNLQSVEMDCTKNGYRIPTEAEWEYIAKGNGSNQYPWGDSISSSSANYLNSSDPFDSNVAPFTQQGGPTTPVGYYEDSYSNDSCFGVSDLSGNVWEWCWDWYNENYYKNSVLLNPIGNLSGDKRVIRGGSWVNYPIYLRNTNRNYNYPDYSGADVGFRIILQKK